MIILKLRMVTPHMSFQGQSAFVQAARVKIYDALAHK